jgi:hypothetical protein
MTAISQLRGKLSVECLYGTCHKDGSKILGKRIWKSDISMCMNDMEKVQAMSSHDECLGYVCICLSVWI